MIEKEAYIEAKRILNRLVDLAEKHNLPPISLVNVVALESLTTEVIIAYRADVLTELFSILRESSITVVDDAVFDRINKMDELREAIAKLKRSQFSS